MLILRTARAIALIFPVIVMAACSSPFSSEPGHKPQYPAHSSAKAPATASVFASGPPYDWETATAPPPRLSEYHFASARTFDETTAWIKKTLDAQLAVANKADPMMLWDDLHFEGCTFLWHEVQGAGTTHINAYSYAINLAHANLEQMLANTSSVRVGWQMDHNVMFHAWEKVDGRWADLGDRLQESGSRDFPVTNLNASEQLRFAFIHASRLCGARVPPY